MIKLNESISIIPSDSNITFLINKYLNYNIKIKTQWNVNKNK